MEVKLECGDTAKVTTAEVGNLVLCPNGHGLQSVVKKYQPGQHLRVHEYQSPGQHSYEYGTRPAANNSCCSLM